MPTATHPKCGKTWTGYRTEHCPACCETFNGHTAGDMHRVGEHGVDRRCLSVQEMLAKGMAQNDAGRWTTGVEFDASVFAGE